MLTLIALAAAASAADPIAYDQAVDVPCPVCASIQDLGGKVTASVSLTEGSLTHGPERALLDADNGTAWCEGAPDNGVGQWIEVTFPKPVHLAGFELLGGYFKDAGRLANNGRIRELSVSLDGKAPFPVAYADGQMRADGSAPLAAVFAPPEGSLPFTKIRWTVTGVYDGAKFQDTCISSLQLWAYDPAAAE